MSWYDGDEAPAPGTGRRAHREERGPGRWGVRWRLGPRAVAGALLVLALVGGAVALRTAAATPVGPAVDLPEPRSTSTSVTADPVASVGSSGDPQPDVGVVVHVVGQVGAPGVVTLPVGSRVADAVAAAGGALPGADLSALNLAAVLTDGAQVHVPLPGEVVAASGEGVTGGAGGSGALGSGTGAGGGVVDLNSASAADLDALPGIGPVLAERIVQWRTEHGRFATVDDLQQVSGIGPAVMDRLRDLVQV